jgi:hypothetical protein
VVAVKALVALAVVLVAGVLGVQLAYGGGQFEPLRPADPCRERTVASQSSGIEGLTEELVLLGLDGAACELGTSRESLTLTLGTGAEVSTAEVRALRAGLRSAVRRMDREGDLPPVSELLDEALDSADLNGFVKAALKAVPDSVVDAALKTDDVLLRAVDELDLRAVLSDLSSPSALNREVEAAVTVAVREALVDRVRSLV